MNKLGRRSFLRASTAAGIGVLGGSFLRFEDLARAQAAPDHFFLFIELKGGVAWHYATDGRDLADLPLADPNVVKLLELSADGSTPPLSDDQRADLLQSAGAAVPHGNTIIVPYVDTPQSSYKTGATRLGAKYTLGLSAHPLAPHVDDIAVVRGVRMIHNFHGGANDEAWSGIFSDHEDQVRKHVAGTLAAHLAEERGALLLDNVVFEGATFPGQAGPDFLAPMRIDVRSLGTLAGAQAASGGSPEQRFQRARTLAAALGDSRALGPQHKEALSAYLAALDKAPGVQKRLGEIASRLSATDASLDLDLQVDTALTLFESGLTRVATLCLGASNGQNNVDGFGLFDAHYGLVHKAPEGAFARRTYGHYLNLEQAMRSLARLIDRLKSTQRNGRSLFEQTTVVVTSEFSRPTNASGNEDFGGAFGAGHYNYNNNVILFGKGVRGGAWVGQNHPVTGYAHLAKMETLERPDPEAIEYAAPDFFTLNPSTNAFTAPLDGTVNGLPAEAAIQFTGGAMRPIMPKDVMRTVFAAAGLEPKFRASYAGRWFSDARAIRAIVG